MALNNVPKIELDLTGPVNEAARESYNKFRAVVKRTEDWEVLDPLVQNGFRENVLMAVHHAAPVLSAQTLRRAGYEVLVRFSGRSKVDREEVVQFLLDMAEKLEE